MAINELTQIVAPPDSPIDPGDNDKRVSVEKNLDTHLPDDYIDYARTFGAGSFIDLGKLRLSIFDPFSKDFENLVRMQAELLNGIKAGGDQSVPFDVFPSLPGLLACGMDDNGNELYWLTHETASRWSIVVRSYENVFEHYDDQLTAFLTKLFTRRIRCSCWPEPFFSDTHSIHFEPERFASPSASVLKSIYELYVENGNAAGFWAQQRGSQPGVHYLVKLIDGKTHGRLPGIPVEYGRPKVNADVYVNNVLFEKDIDLINAYQQVFTFSDGRGG